MRLEDWLDLDAVNERLTAAGMSPDCAERAAGCFEKAARSLRPIVRDRSVVACWVPGRIEVLGKHTDYCGGDSILAATECGFAMLATPRDDGKVTIIDPKYTFREIVLDKKFTQTAGHWSNYPHTVVHRLAKNFPNARRGATIAFDSNLPPAAGMSSSSAFIVGTFLLLSQINDLPNNDTYAAVIRSRDDLAGYLSTVENGMSFGLLAGDKGVGTFGGSEDHVAILQSRPNALVHYAYCPVQFKRAIRLADDYVFAIASSGVVAEKTGAALAKYNRVSLLAKAIVEIWTNQTGQEPSSLAEIIRSGSDTADELRKMLGKTTHSHFTGQDLIERLDHFVMESKLIAAVPNSIDAASVAPFGKLVSESHCAGARLLKNQTPETLRLVEIANERGAYTASAFGAGFGGSVWALIDTAEALPFLTKWQDQYRCEFPVQAERSEFFVTRPETAAITFA
jgi:galactokinase